MSEEIWKDIAGFGQHYQISSHGQVRSKDRISQGRYGPKKTSGRILATHIRNGYPSISLTGGGVSRTITVHCLVAAAFIGERPSGADIAHGDGNRSNSKIENLRYCSRKENAEDSRKHGTLALAFRHHNKKFSKEDILDIIAVRALGARVPDIATEFGASESYIYGMIRGDRTPSYAGLGADDGQ